MRFLEADRMEVIPQRRLEATCGRCTRWRLLGKMHRPVLSLR